LADGDAASDARRSETCSTRPEEGRMRHWAATLGETGQAG